MSIAVGPADYGMLGSLIANASSVKQKLNTLTNQVSTGLIGNTYAGLGAGASIRSTSGRRWPTCGPGRTTWMPAPGGWR